MMKCPHCGLIHETTCPRIKSIEYHENGMTKRVEFHPPASTWLDGPGTFRHKPGCAVLSAGGDPQCTCDVTGPAPTIVFHGRQFSGDRS